MSHSVEEKLAQDIKTIITYANQGMHPDDAVQKVAEDEQYNPELIKTACGVFNKSKAAAYLQKMSSDKRGNSFSLADSAKIIRRIYGQEKVSEDKAILPSGNFSDIDFRAEFDKAAEATGEGQGQGNGSQGTGGTAQCYCPACGHTEDHERNTPCNQKKCPECGASMTGLSSDKTAEDLPFDMVKTAAEKYAGLYKRASDEYDRKISWHKQKVQDCLEKIADNMKRMPVDKLRKTAQLTVNGYPEFGHKILELVQSHMTQTIPEVEKTAFAAVFPSNEPYISMSELCDHAYKLRDFKLAKNAFEKNADVGERVGKFLRWVTETSVPTGDVKGEHTPSMSKIVGGIGRFTYPRIEEYTSGKYKSGPADKIKDFLGPDVHNTLKEITAKKNFILLSLYDKHLKHYNMQDLAEAYNYVSASSPEIYNDPAALKPAMLSYLEHDGYTDVAMYQQSQQTRKDRANAERAIENDIRKKFQDIGERIDTKFPVKTMGSIQGDKEEKSEYKTKMDKSLEKHIKGNISAKHAKQAGDRLRSALSEGDMQRAKSLVTQIRQSDESKKLLENKELKNLVAEYDKQEGKQEKDKKELDTYKSSLQKAVSKKNVDLATAILKDIYAQYPDSGDPELKEIIREYEDMMNKSNKKRRQAAQTGRKNSGIVR